MSRQTNNSSGRRGHGEDPDRPRSASPSSSDAPSLADDHVASASLPDLLSPPSHEVASGGEFLPPGDGTEAASSSFPGGATTQPPLLPILDAATSYEPLFSDWFEATFAVPDYRRRLLSAHAAQPALVSNWLGLLNSTWCASAIPGDSATFGMQLLAVFSTALPVPFVKSFLMFSARDSAGPSALTQVPSHLKPQTYVGKIDGSTFDPLRAHVKHGQLSGNWQHIVNDCFDKALGLGHVITFTDLSSMTPLALLHHLGASHDISKFLLPDLRSSAPPPTASPAGTLRNLLADGAGRKSDKEILLSRFAQLQPLLVPHRLTPTQVEQLQLLVSLLSPDLQDIPSSTLLSHTAHAMNNLCSFICNFCVALADVLVKLRVQHSERWHEVVKHVCPQVQHSRLDTVTIDNLAFSQVLDPLTKALRSSCSLFAVLPAFQAVTSMIEILAVVPSKSKHAVLLQVLSHQFDFSNSFLSEMQRFFDVRSAALVSLGASPFFSGIHPGLQLGAIKEMLNNNLYGVRLEKSTDNIALESFVKTVLPECKSFEDILHGVRLVSGDHALQGNAADAPASVHMASSQPEASTSAPRTSRRPNKPSRSARKAASSSSPSKAADSSDASPSSKPSPVRNSRLQKAAALGKAVVQLLKAKRLNPDDYVRQVQFQRVNVYVWLREAADSSARIIKVPQDIYKSFTPDERSKVVALMRAGNRQFKDCFVADFFGSQVRSRTSSPVARVANASRLPPKSSSSHATAAAVASSDYTASSSDFPAAAISSESAATAANAAASTHPAALPSALHAPAASSAPFSQLDPSALAVIDKALNLLSVHQQHQLQGAAQPSHHAMNARADGGPSNHMRPDFTPPPSPPFSHGAGGGAPMPFPGSGVFPNYACNMPPWQPPMPCAPQMQFPQLEGPNPAAPSDSN